MSEKRKEVQSIYPGHLLVQDHHVHMLGFQAQDHPLSARLLDDPMARPFQNIVEQSPHLRIIVNDQHGGGSQFSLSPHVTS